MNATSRTLELLDREILRSSELADDLKLIREGILPSKTLLEKCPLVEYWALGTRPARCLSGIFIGHPKIEYGSAGVTSELVWIDKDRGIARTRSRFYRLGSPA